MNVSVIKSLLLDNQIFHFSRFKEFPNDENVTKQKPFQREEMENIRKKKSIRSFTELKKNSPMVFHLNQTVSQIIKMFAKLFNYHAIYNRLKAIVNS